jgi:hypothetical protein
MLYSIDVERQSVAVADLIVVAEFKDMRFRTPYQAIEELWKSKPDALIVKRSHHMLAPNT